MNLKSVGWWRRAECAAWRCTGWNRPKPLQQIDPHPLNRMLLILTACQQRDTVMTKANRVLPARQYLLWLQSSQLTLDGWLTLRVGCDWHTDKRGPCSQPVKHPENADAAHLHNPQLKSCWWCSQLLRWVALKTPPHPVTGIQVLCGW